MSEGKQLRLRQVARKLNVGRNTIINYLHEKGYEIDSSPNTKIDNALYTILENAFQDSAVEKVASNIKIGLEEKAIKPSESMTETDLKDNKEVDKKDKEKKSEDITQKKETEGIKIIKKIDLKNNDTKRVASSDQTKKEKKAKEKNYF